MTVSPTHLVEGSALFRKMNDGTARVGVIGMGYVGLPTMMSVAEAGFNVTGVDTDNHRVARINAGDSYIEDIPSDSLATMIGNGSISATSDFAVVSRLDILIVCVPTPLTNNRQPDLRFLESAVDAISEYMRSEQLVILQSTSYPGTTEEFVQPRLERNGRRAGIDFYLAFALERIDPGNERSLIESVPKVVGGTDATSTQMACAFFSTFLSDVIPSSSSRVAEMTKLLENTFRSVNIALVNELSILCGRMGIDIWEVIQAASTKPYGYMPFYPGPGVGGHCIPVDPFYLSWKANEYDFSVNFVQLAAEVNDNMPYYTVTRIGEILNGERKPLNGSRILICGVAFKENISDTRNSPAARVIQLLIDRGADVSYSDPHVPTIEIGGTHMSSQALDPAMLQVYDATVILVNHSRFNLEEIVEHGCLVIDAKNATKDFVDRGNIAKI